MAKTTKSFSERRMVENQVVFREYNERLQKNLDAHNKIADEENQEPLVIDGSLPLYFYCECSDENCQKRIKVAPDVYNSIHQQRDTFIIMCGHEVKAVEDVTATEPNYCVVTKLNPAPSSAPALNKTDVDNS
jgi:hypothetical protein